MEHFDKGSEKIIYTVPKLLHIGMLVRGAFVAVYRDPLVNDLVVQVLFLAQRLHDKLLEIFWKQHQPVSIREDHHVLLSPAARCMIPGNGQERRRIGAGVLSSCEPITERSAF